MTKIIFLDIDGVITTLESEWRFNQAGFDKLKQILDATGAMIVLSSSWRSHNVLSTVERLKKKDNYFNNGLEFPFCNKIIGVTPRLMPQKLSQRVKRGDEIKKWLEDNQFDDLKYIIIDDDTDMLEEQLPYFVNTHWLYGLQDDTIQKAIDLLNS